MTISSLQYQEMLARTSRNKLRDAPSSEQPAAEREIKDIHIPIMRWCESQYPQVPCVHARSDKASRITEGAPDFVILYRGFCLLIECKSKTGKLSLAQSVWHALARLQNHHIYIVRSFEEFLKIIENLYRNENNQYRNENNQCENSPG